MIGLWFSDTDIDPDHDPGDTNRSRGVLVDEKRSPGGRTGNGLKKIAIKGIVFLYFLVQCLDNVFTTQ